MFNRYFISYFNIMNWVDEGFVPLSDKTKGNDAPPVITAIKTFNESLTGLVKDPKFQINWNYTLNPARVWDDINTRIELPDSVKVKNFRWLNLGVNTTWEFTCILEIYWHCFLEWNETLEILVVDQNWFEQTIYVNVYVS
jgi:hypothetical protein